ncbi:hypothetical protein [Pseudonocardia sp. GCM10023141]|uniref:hypothetical protein n=1 Tax=Pseudonocardia sp. GCM10023141 TaxID=3252653 RepID=UPI00362401B2
MSTSTSTDHGARLDATIARAREHQRGRQRAVLLELLAAVIDSDTWDEGVYDVRPDDDWLLIHRASWGAIRDIVETIDSWRPWTAEQHPPEIR